MTLPFRANCQPASLSAFPHNDPQAAWHAVARWMPGLPAIPLLVNQGETLPLLATRGFAGAEMHDRELIIDRKAALRGLDALYANYLRGTPLHGIEVAALPYVIHPEQSAIRRAQALSSMVLGPVSLALTAVDDQATPILDHPELLDALGKHVFLHQVWQHTVLERTGKPVMVWVFEPYLDVMQSSFNPALLDALVAAIDQALGTNMLRALWLPNLETALALPEYVRLDALALPLPAPDMAEASGAMFQRLIANKTALAWGIVPVTSEGLALATAGRLAARFEAWLRALEATGIPVTDVLGASLIMPEDTLAYLGTSDAERALARTAELSSLIRQSYGVE